MKFARHGIQVATVVVSCLHDSHRCFTTEPLLHLHGAIPTKVRPSVSKTEFVCQHCDFRYPKWAGQCSECGAWNSLTETTVARPKTRDLKRVEGKRAPVALNEISNRPISRLLTGLSEFDRVLGSGLVEGTVVLLGGEPGIGKSTLALQCAAMLSSEGLVLYISGEESLQQIGLRASRMGLAESPVRLLSETNLEAVLQSANDIRPTLLVIDSIQTLSAPEIESASGSISQIRSCAEQLVRFAKESDTVILMIGHVTKEGVLAGPKVLEHIVDTVLYFEGDPDSRFRLVRAFKNRYGPVNEIGVFAMTQSGLRGVDNPSAMFLSSGGVPSSGRAVLAVQEGSRPLLVEIQALVDESPLANPRRVCVGLDNGRIGMLLAVLHRHAGISLSDRDVYVNVAGGMRIGETASDVAVAMAIVSSFLDRPLPAGMVCFGEIGLAGEIRPVQRGMERLKEAHKLGFQVAVLPKDNWTRKPMPGMEIICASVVADLVAQFK